ncbi:MAG: cytochrome P450 [Dongiaceae bacterium]
MPGDMPAPARSRLAGVVGRRALLLAALARWDEWYDSKLPVFLAALCYAGLVADSGGRALAVDMAWLLVLFGCYAAFGHIVNDYADREVDRLAGKARPIGDFGEPAALALMIAPAAATMAIALWRFDRGTVALTAAALAVAALYSLPPARLKTRGVLGLVAATLAQRTAPLAIGIQALQGWDAGAAAIVLLGTCIGVRFILVHQALDWENDLRTGVETVGTRISRVGLFQLVKRRVFPVECAGVVLTAAAVSGRAPLVLAVFVLFLLKEAVYWRRGARPRPVTYDLFSDFYCVLLPVALSLSLTLAEPRLAWTLALAAALSWRQLRYRLQLHATLWAGDTAAARERGYKGPGTSAPAQTGDPAAPPPPAALWKDVAMDKNDPYPLYADLRLQAPLVRVNWPQLGSTWIVTRHREAMAALLDERFVCSSSNVLGSPADDGARGAPLRGFGPDLPEMDPPDHTRLRRLVGKAFTRGMIERYEARIEQLASEILDKAEAEGSIELISDYATAIPITIITEILGVEIRNIKGFAGFMRLLAMSGAGRPELQAAKQRFTNRLQALFAERRQAPRNDLVSALVEAEQDGDKLSAEELIGMVYLLLLGGFITTANLIGNGTLALLRNPGQMELLRGNPQLAESAVEELLRYDSPLELSSMRHAATDLESCGKQLRAGARIRVLIPAVNRDPEVFAAPDTLNLERSPCPHLAFGHGIHYCLGAPLARLEGRVALPLLVRRFPDLRIADGGKPEWQPHPVLRGLARLPLRLRP